MNEAISSVRMAKMGSYLDDAIAAAKTSNAQIALTAIGITDDLGVAVDDVIRLSGSKLAAKYGDDLLLCPLGVK